MDVDGKTIRGPRRIEIHKAQDLNPEHISRLVGPAMFSTAKVLRHDILVLTSDGIHANLSEQTMLHTLDRLHCHHAGYSKDDAAAYHFARAVVQDFLESALRADAPRPDDAAVYVGVLTSIG